MNMRLEFYKVFCILDGLYGISKDRDSICESNKRMSFEVLLGALNPFLWSDYLPADKGMYSDCLRIIEENCEAPKQSALQIMKFYNANGFCLDSEISSLENMSEICISKYCKSAEEVYTMWAQKQKCSEARTK